MTDTPAIPPSPTAAIAAIQPTDGPPLSLGERSEVADRQDQLMAQSSVEGTPPSHEARRTGWTVFFVTLPIVLVGGLIVALLQGVDIPTVLCFAVIMAILLALGGGPVLAAGLSRGREETAARKDAMSELHPGENAP